MNKALDRIRIGELGQLEIVDPGFTDLPLLLEIDPTYRIKKAPLPGFRHPRFQKSQSAGVRVGRRILKELTINELWELHAATMSWLYLDAAPSSLVPGEASLLQVKSELAWRLLGACSLCAHRCGVDRTVGRLGICRLGTTATVGRSFVHIAEEPPINPSLVLNLTGCGLRCRFCQQHELLDPRKARSERLSAELWQRIDATRARSLSFVGGNPDESLFAILQFIGAAPESWALPVVWNNHAYSTPEVLALLDGVIDCYVPDFKYGAAACGERLSGAKDYPATAKAAVAMMVAQEVPVIVRHLVLPEHVACCSLPVLDALASLNCRYLFASVRDQYCPDWKITRRDGALSRRPNGAEIEAVFRHATSLGLHLVGEEEQTSWAS